jgi:uncharacterized protein
MSLGFKTVRVRSHGDVARIEISRKDRRRLFNEELLDRIAKQLKEFGYRYVALDLEGYRTGSMNNKDL